jgi:phosphopantetheine--protein transferase-like protein
MEMREEIKVIYSNLSGGKVIEDDAYVITQRQFSSVLVDRFVAELRKLGITWNKKDIAFGELLSGKAGEPTESRVVLRAGESPAVNAVAVTSKTPDFSIGIDIQDVAELPDCVDYWENEFYKMRFTPEEIAYGVSRNNPKETFAGIYSCKEALVKCNNELEWSDIAITHGTNGDPLYADYHLSISHSGNNAIAIAVKHKAANYRPASDIPVSASETVDQSTPGVRAGKRGTSKTTGLLFFLVTVVILYLLYRDFIR